MDINITTFFSQGEKEIRYIGKEVIIFIFKSCALPFSIKNNVLRTYAPLPVYLVIQSLKIIRLLFREN